MMIAPKLFFKTLLFRLRNLRNPPVDLEKNYDFRLIGRYFRHRSGTHYYQVISDNVANDIDIDETFEKIDKTTSRIGQQYLYAKIRTIGNQADLWKFDQLVTAFQEEPSLVDNIKKRLSKLSSTNGYFFEEMFQGEQLKRISLTVPYLLSLLFLLFAVLAFFNGFFVLLLLPIYIANMGLHYYNKRSINYYIWGVSELTKSIKVAKHLLKEPIVARHFKEVSFLDELIKTERTSSLITFEKRYDGDVTSILFLIVELLKITLNMEIILFHHYLDEIERKKEQLHLLFCFIGEVDSAISVAKIRVGGNKLCKPLFVDKKYLEVVDVVHPLVDDCVPNSLQLIERSLLLTGSNMSGKTTFIRAITINALLAQTINCCFAKEYSAPFFKIFSSIRIVDSIQDKTSYFLEELLVIKEFVEQAGSDECCLFVLDEIFKGTNTLERIAAGKSILAFLNSGKHLVLASTHDIELADLLEKNAYECYHFCETIVDNELIFDYQLHHGRLGTKNAIKILEIYNFPPHIIKEARETQQYLSESTLGIRPVD